MTETPEEQLRVSLNREQQHFEALASQSDIEALKERVMRGVDDQIKENKTSDRNIHLRMPTYFAMAATVVLSVSILLYTQLTPTQLQLINQADINSETQYISSLTNKQLLSLEAVQMSMDPNDPIITLEQPADLKNITTPFELKLSFEASPSSEINPNSFQLTYGLLGVDITERLLNSATITPNQLKVEGLDLPSGQHTLTVVIADSEGRESQARYKFVVNK